MSRDPFERLLRAHQNIEERLRDLERAARTPDDPAARDAVRDALGFFGRAGVRHVEDEERSLFPRLTGEPELAVLVATLTEEHRQQEALLARLEEGVERRGELAPLVAEFAACYRTHTRREDEQLLPAARRLLPPGALESMAQEMEQRRPGGGQHHRR